jgi:hypothetical protein
VTDAIRLTAQEPDVVPSFVEMLASRTWTHRAACAQPPHDGLRWVFQLASGTEPPKGVVARFEICATCEVRRECLDDAIGERRWSVMGVFGGTTMTERSHAVNTLRVERRSHMASVSSETVKHGSLGDEDEIEIRAAAADNLDATFDIRLALWRQRRDARIALLPTEGQTECAHCGQGFLWPRTEADTCSFRCRRLARREALDQGVKLSA